MGVSTFAHPCCQAFALPLFKDKQRSQPTPSGIINTTHAYTIIHKSISSICRDIIHPNADVPLHYLCEEFLSCEVRQHRMITFVNAFPRPALQTAWWSLFHRCLDPPCPRKDWLSHLQKYELFLKLQRIQTKKRR